MRQLALSWDDPPDTPTPGATLSTFLVNSFNRTFRLRAANQDDALEQARGISRDRKSCTTVYEEVEGRCGQRLAAFDPKGRRYL